jgi:hypothetical protein
VKERLDVALVRKISHRVHGEHRGRKVKTEDPHGEHGGREEFTEGLGCGFDLKSKRFLLETRAQVEQRTLVSHSPSTPVMLPLPASALR